MAKKEPVVGIPDEAHLLEERTEVSAENDAGCLLIKKKRRARTCEVAWTKGGSSYSEVRVSSRRC